jgi:Phage integrase family
MAMGTGSDLARFGGQVSGGIAMSEILERKRIPNVRTACPKGRPIQLRYFDPTEGREIRISTGTHDASEAAEKKKDLEAKLRLGIDAKRSATTQPGPNMTWESFRLEYTRLHLDGLRDKTSIDAESRLDIAERIVKPITLADMASRESLVKLKDALLSGAEGRYDPPRPRSAHSVRSHMASVLAALHWAEADDRGWLTGVPKISKVKTAKLRHMKGRPITTEEFERMLAVTAAIVGETAAPSWKHLLRGLWTSALRLDELMHLSWDDRNQICPEWPKRRLPVLNIPASRQKNDTAESIPLLPDFEALLLQAAEEDRAGWAFNPQSLQGRLGRKARHGRPDAEWVGKIISRIGEKAGVVVHPGNKETGRPAKFASAHDLRRSLLDRLVDADVPPLVVQRIARHANFETTQKHYAKGDVQKAAAKLRAFCLDSVDVEDQLLELVEQSGVDGVR